MDTGSPYPDFIADPFVCEQAIQRIARAVAERSARFLFGAGMSVESEVPASETLLLKLLTAFFPTTSMPSENQLKGIARSFPFEAAVEVIEKSVPGGKRADLTKALENLLLVPGFVPSKAHFDFVSVCLWGGSPRMQRVFTTNFDQLLEDALGRHLAEPVVESNAGGLEEIVRQGRIGVLHLHGLLDGEYKITETDIYDKTFSVLTAEFGAALATSGAFVFVGYSMWDPDFRGIFMAHRQEILNRKRLERNTYVVSPAADEHHYRFGKEVWNARGTIWIPLSAGDFFARLRQALTFQFAERARSLVAKHYDVNEQGGLDQLIQTLADVLGVSADEALVYLYEQAKYGGSSE